jgi:hypothetical protein
MHSTSIVKNLEAEGGSFGIPAAQCGLSFEVSRDRDKALVNFEARSSPKELDQLVPT